MPNEDIKGEGTQGQPQDFYTIDMEDVELARMIDSKIQRAYGEYEKLRTEGKTNERYWAKEQLEGINLYWHNSRIVANRIYTSVETMVPIITSKPAEPMITLTQGDEGDRESKEERELSHYVERLLMDKYADVDHPQQEMFEMIARHLLLYKLGIPKIRWDEPIDDYIIEFVHPHKVIISPDGHYNEDVWTAEYMEKTVKEMIDEFPDKENDLLANLFPGQSVPDSMMATPVGFWEYWSEDGKFMVWKMQNVILQKKLNPYIKWTSTKEFDKNANHFRYPKKPLMFLNSQNLGKHIWDDTTPVSQGLSLQDGINIMQRIITDTARDQGILVGAQELIDRDELYKYTGAYNEKLSVKGGDPARALYRVAPKQLANFVTENLIHLKSEMDNVMGTHATTRGEKSKQPTLGQDVMSKESDYGRIDAIVRGIERVAAEIYNWELQMMVAMYEEEHYARIVGEKNAGKVKKAIETGIKKKTKITVKPGSTLPTDKITQRNEAIELVKANKISTIDFFERMDYPNPKEMAQNLYLQETAPEQLFPDLVKQLDEKNKKEAGDQGRLNPDGTIQPGIEVPVPAAPPSNGMVPALAPQAPPAQPASIPAATPPAVPIAAPAAPAGTEHTQALVQGQPVQPFEGIDPSQYAAHVSAELQFMGSGEFASLPEEVQAQYANHVLKERQMVQGQT